MTHFYALTDFFSDELESFFAFGNIYIYISLIRHWLEMTEIVGRCRIFFSLVFLNIIGSNFQSKQEQSSQKYVKLIPLWRKSHFTWIFVIWFRHITVSAYTHLDENLHGSVCNQYRSCGIWMSKETFLCVWMWQNIRTYVICMFAWDLSLYQGYQESLSKYLHIVKNKDVFTLFPKWNRKKPRTRYELVTPIRLQRWKPLR